MDTLLIGTRIEVPLILPLSSGKSQSTVLDAPVVWGIMLLKMDRFVRFLSWAEQGGWSGWERE